jgi:hypothetical protein
MDDGLRTFSYALLVSPNGRSAIWAVFPKACGLDSGGNLLAYQLFERLIQMLTTKLEVDLKKYDVPYQELEIFLLKEYERLYSLNGDKDIKSLFRYDESLEVLSGSGVDLENVLDGFQRRNYSQALRDLRALVQSAEENLIARRGISRPPKPNVNNLAEVLIKANVIDKGLDLWFLAFSSIANNASHNTGFPTEQYMKDPVLQKRVFLTFYLGVHLLEELNKACDLWQS